MDPETPQGQPPQDPERPRDRGPGDVPGFGGRLVSGSSGRLRPRVPWPGSWFSGVSPLAVLPLWRMPKRVWEAGVQRWRRDHIADLNAAGIEGAWAF